MNRATVLGALFALLTNPLWRSIPLVATSLHMCSNTIRAISSVADRCRYQKPLSPSHLPHTRAPHSCHELLTKIAAVDKIVFRLRLISFRYDVPSTHFRRVSCFSEKVSKQVKYSKCQYIIWNDLFVGTINKRWLSIFQCEAQNMARRSPMVARGERVRRMPSLLGNTTSVHCHIFSNFHK